MTRCIVSDAVLLGRSEGLCYGRDAQQEHASSAGPPGIRHITALCQRERAGNREPEASSRDICRHTGRTVERLEDTFGIGLGYPFATIGYRDHEPRAIAANSQLDRLGGGTVFGGILDEVDESAKCVHEVEDA